MKKALSILLILSLLACAFALPASAARSEGQWYRQYLDQYFDGKEPQSYDDCNPFVYEEIFAHQTGGETDWALIHADVGEHAEALTYDIFFGRAFAKSDISYPFTYDYGIYDAAQERFFDFSEIADDSLYPGLQETLDAFHVGVRVSEAQYGDDLRYQDAFIRETEGFANGRSFTAEEAVCFYDELYYHETNGATDWALVQGTYWFRYPDCPYYERIGDRVFRGDGLYEPFGSSYAVYHVATQRFYNLRSSLVNLSAKISQFFPDLMQVIDELNLGEKLGDLNRDGRLDISDATEMQRCLAEYTDYPAADDVESAGYQNRGGETVQYLSDLTQDGKRDIRDVTAVQKRLLNLS